ncbi:spermidine synthase [Janthinobacterium fluminis]|uniref:Fused MFS/spermidine synthase n=1 Tax=Janthinobacterium fluminis TaxID=2987524 RepID=A0ABT5JV10_9BURK|nr:fused MFS/spermidine synthase [Janthinobacterium fluminis]MDC8755983.1 fused MFS/spermidine synthase [Janthinobacterium fluminis]
MIFLYACTIFLSAFLLFQIQPIIGKMILPWFGGSAAVWSTCMLFFQVLLLLGYLYAHLTTRRLRPRRQALLHIALLAASVALLPITLDEAYKPAGNAEPTLTIIGLMAASIGLPYFLLSASGPLLQAWFAREKPGSIPYRLFALSNFGSMLGLLSYPLLFEPSLTLPHMSVSWSAAYAVFALLCAALALRGVCAHAARAPAAAAPVGAAPSGRRRLAWLALAALPTILLMSVTSHLTQNVAPIPLLWVAPLSIYLTSFILCFEGGGWYRRNWYLPMFMLSIAGMVVFFIAPALMPKTAWLPILLYCGGLFCCCMVCHGELARLKPHASQLTTFYLMLASGGALGGIFVAIVAPRLFNDDYELVLAAIASVVAVFTVVYREPGGAAYRFVSREAWLKITVFSVTLTSLLVAAIFLFAAQQNIVQRRDFYGTVKVKDVGLGEQRYRQLSHGVILHGFQYLDAAKRRWPTSYYGADSGAGVALLAGRGAAPQKVGVVGLGAGTMAAYCRHGDAYRFYEINPLVIGLAASAFSYLPDCPAQMAVVQGDARLSLEREPAQHFDVLVLDAFSGDSIPVHLLTREAFGLYFRHLKPGGMLAVHISNQHLNLAPVVKLAADYYAKEARLVQSKQDQRRGVGMAEWIVISDGAAIFQSGELKSAARTIHAGQHIRPWTDDYSSIYAILK